MPSNSNPETMSANQYLAYLQRQCAPGYEPPNYGTLSKAYDYVQRIPGYERLSIDEKERLMHEYLDRISYIESQPRPTPHEDPLFNYMVSLVLDDLNGTIANSGYRLDQDIAIGTLPTTSINAQAIAVPSGGKVIALNHGILHFMMALAETATWFCLSSVSDKPEMISVVCDRSKIDTSGAGHVLFTEIMVAYLKTMKQNTAVDLAQHIRQAYDTCVSLLGYRLEKPREEFVNTLGESIIVFILAHEFSHIILGHLDTNTLPLQIGTFTVHAISRSHKNEFDADRLGLDLTIKCNRATGYNLVTSYIGVDFLFSCMLLLEKALDLRQNDSHPPTRERRESTREMLRAYPNNQ